MSEYIPLAAFTFLVAFIYSSVGHGGASGYLALLSFFAIPPVQMATSALCLNLLVAGMAFYSFFRAGYFEWKFARPFALASVPLAFTGGLIKVSSQIYSFLLAAVLVFAAVRMLMQLNQDRQEPKSSPPLFVSLSAGGFIGILSGIVGVGGGIFLSPLILLCRWAGAKKTAALSAFFILVNSSAGLLGRIATRHFELTPLLLSMILTAFLGGMTGSRLGANHFSGKWLRIILAGVLFLAAFKLLRVLFL